MENVHNFPKRAITKFMDSSDPEWDELLPCTCYCCNIIPSSTCTESPFFLMFGWDPAEGHLTYLNNKRYYGTNEGKIVLEELHKLGKHHAKHLRELYQRNEHKDQQINKNNPKLEIGQVVIVVNHAHPIFEPKYLLDCRVLKVLNNSTLLSIMPNGKRKKNKC